MFFERYFKDVNFNTPKNEVQVRCPFPHYDPTTGQAYHEKNPSASVNKQKRLFYCHMCGEGMNEFQFYQKMTGEDITTSMQVINAINSNIKHVARPKTYSPEQEKILTDLHFNIETCKEMQIDVIDNQVGIPVIVYGTRLDYRKYNPFHKENGEPKTIVQDNAMQGLINPYDLWKEDGVDKPTMIMAGEKDLILARSLGVNAISITGKEGTIPKLFKKDFAGKTFYILYDNDDAGHKGALQVAVFLKNCGATVYNVTGHHEVCVERGEDFYDYIVKYGKTLEDLKEILKATPEFTEEDKKVALKRINPSTSLLEATSSEKIKKKLSTNIQVLAMEDGSYSVPNYVIVESETLGKITWTLDHDNIGLILSLLVNRDKLDSVIKKLVKIPKGDTASVKYFSYIPVFKATVTDMFDINPSTIVNTKYDSPIEYEAYFVDAKVNTGEKYNISYILTPHPNKANKNVVVAYETNTSFDSVTNFVLTDKVKESLRVFQGDVSHFDEVFEKSKGFIGATAHKDIFTGLELAYHSPLYIQFGRTTIKGALDIAIVSDTRMGKSTTFEAMRKMYKGGAFGTLKNATVAGIIGGSDKGANGFQTKAGIIPRNHKGLVALDEASGADTSVIAKMTDVRSSGNARIIRVNGELVLPAVLRLVWLSNPRVRNGETRTISSYANGVEIVQSLFGASEDIARFDFIQVLSSHGVELISPLQETEASYPTESYVNRLRWVWSRSDHQVKFIDGADQYIIDVTKELNKKYDSPIKLLGNEAYKKVARISTALAGCLVSTDEDFENILVKKEHVEWARDFLISTYDNTTFRLREYVQEQRAYSEMTEDSTAFLKAMLEEPTSKRFVSYMERFSELDKSTLQAFVGLKGDELSLLISEFAYHHFIKLDNSKMVTTEKFRRTYIEVKNNLVGGEFLW